MTAITVLDYTDALWYVRVCTRYGSRVVAGPFDVYADADEARRVVERGQDGTSRRTVTEEAA